MAQTPGSDDAPATAQPEEATEVVPVPGATHTKTPWSGWDLVLVLLVGLAFGVVLAAALLAVLAGAGVDLSDVIQIAIASVAIYAATAVAAWFLAIKRRGTDLASAGFRWTGWGPVLIAIPILIGLMLVSAVILVLIEELIGGVPTAQQQVTPAGTTLGLLDFLWLFLAGFAAAPIAEEFFFRGLVFPYLRARAGLVVAVLASAALFAVLHLTPQLMPPLFVFGVVQALLVHRYGSLYPAILLHALNNGALIAVVYSTG